MAKEAGDIIYTGRTYFNGRSRKKEYSSNQKLTVRIRRQKRRNEERSLYNGYR